MNAAMALTRSNTSVQVIQEGRPVIVPLPPVESHTLPSVVCLREGEQPLVGQSAKRCKLREQPACALRSLLEQ